MPASATPSAFMIRLWDLGQQHLAAGRYVAACIDLESAEKIAWRRHDALALSRIYLPLLEARRQIRYLAVEGPIHIANPNAHHHIQSPASATLGHLRAALLTPPPAATYLFCAHSRQTLTRAISAAHAVSAAARRTGRCLEALLLITHRDRTCLASPNDPRFAAGLPVDFTTDPSRVVSASTDAALRIPLPPPGTYDGQSPGAGSLARESLLIAWEGLGLNWQHRHFRNSKPRISIWRSPPAAAPHLSAWAELRWLRNALRIDPASEPITMRLIALAESLARQP